MPLLKGASSDYTTFIKYNALTLPAGAVKSASAVALPRASIMGTLMRASAVASKSSPRTSVLKTYDAVVVAAAAPVVPMYLPVSLGYDAFIVRYNSDGVANLVITTRGSADENGYGIALDTTGIYVTGRYQYASSIVTLTNNKTLPANVGADAFTVKYNTTGLAQWATAITSSGASDRGSAITVNSTGVYVTGRYTSTSVITLATGVELPITAGGTPGDDAFIVKYDITTGTALWANTIRGTSTDYGYSIASDSTHVYVGFQYGSSSTIDLGSGIVLPSSGGIDLAVVKYNAGNGTPVWAKTIRGTGGESANGIALDSTGVYVTGAYRNNTSIDLGSGVVLPSYSTDSVFVLKYTKDGTPVWAKTINGTGGYTEGTAIAVDSTGVYITGTYDTSSSITFATGIVLPATLGLRDGLVAKYNATDGTPLWATTISGTADDSGYGIAVYSTGVYVTGYYTSTSAVTLNNGKALPVGAGSQDMFFVKYDTTTGLAQWATTINTNQEEFGRGVVADSTGIYVVGDYYRSGTPLLLRNGS